MPRRFRNTAGPFVRRLRVKKSLTQDQLAARLVLEGLGNADRVWVAKVESQIRSVFDFELVVIAAALGVTPDELLPKAKELKKSLGALQDGVR